ncbi:MAG: glutathione S-transferase [Benjaminiella poitrasii]|nr:MAG: glutathione S-transferase [Benjaminiella poitrasii]
MTFTNKITFYNCLVCPFAQRAAIALKLVGANVEEVLIDLDNKPDWYKNVNPELKVPAFNAEGQNIAESLVIIEYINDLFPEKKLLPDAPLKRANIRFAIEFFGTKIIPAHYKYVLNFHAEGAEEEYKKSTNAALVRFNELLLQEAPSGPYFLGEQFSLADIAIAPFVLRTFAFNKKFLKGYEFETIKSHPRLAQFIEGITSHPVVKETYIGDDGYTDRLEKKYFNKN